MDKKTFIKMNTAYGNNNSRKMKEITTVYVDGPTKMMGNEYVSMEKAANMDIPVYDDSSHMWVYRNIADLLLENKTTRDIVIAGVSQGAYNEGMHIPAGTSFEDIIQQMLTLTVPASYTTPSCNINGSESKIIEAGTIISPTITPSFIKNDAGNINKYVLRKNGTIVQESDVLRTYTDTNMLIGDATVSFRATMFHDAGVIKNNNIGTPSPEGHIQAGSVLSNIVSYTGVRNLFFGCSSSNTVDLNNEEIRTLNKKANPVAGTALTLNISAGANKVIIAYPSVIPDISSIKYVEGLNAEVKSIFKKSLLDIAGANNYNPIEYKIFTYIPDVPFSNNATYNIII